MTTQSEIAEWFNRGVADGYRYMMVGVDTFDKSDYPIYIMTQKEGMAKAWEHERIMEIYDLQGRLAEQLSEKRTWAFRLGNETTRAVKEHLAKCGRCKEITKNPQTIPPPKDVPEDKSYGLWFMGDKEGNLKLGFGEKAYVIPMADIHKILKEYEVEK